MIKATNLISVLQLLLFRARPGRGELAGLVLGVGGILVLLNPTAIDWAYPGEVAGTLALLVSAVIWAGATIHVRHHRWTATPLDLQPWQLLVALVPLAILALLFEAGRSVHWDATTFAVLAFSGPLATAFAYWASQSITRSLGPLATATGFLAVPVVGLASGGLFLGEPLGIADLVGFGLILAGVAAASLAKPAPA